MSNKYKETYIFEMKIQTRMHFSIKKIYDILTSKKSKIMKNPIPGEKMKSFLLKIASLQQLGHQICHGKLHRICS